ncbi:MAG TPA: DNA recombination protein RmuC, partial [Candidatus Paceibacterota bacterium]|nr:DNA recombination protein RmuC [Candidatus Paceibacterota bacterium]
METYFHNIEEPAKISREKVAEDLLKMSGFVRGIQYDYNKAQGENDTRPDFTIKLPDGTKINIDAK